MRIGTLLLAACFSLTATAVRADDAWHGPGWYVMAYDLAIIIWSGPYGSKDACEAAKPADEEFEYGCSYLTVEPG